MMDSREFDQTTRLTRLFKLIFSGIGLYRPVVRTQLCAGFITTKDDIPTQPWNRFRDIRGEFLGWTQ